MKAKPLRFFLETNVLLLVFTSRTENLDQVT